MGEEEKTLEDAQSDLFERVLKLEPMMSLDEAEVRKLFGLQPEPVEKKQPEDINLVHENIHKGN